MFAFAQEKHKQILLSYEGACQTHSMNRKCGISWNYLDKQRKKMNDEGAASIKSEVCFLKDDLDVTEKTLPIFQQNFIFQSER